MNSIFILLSLLTADFPICNASGRQWHPSVASCRERYLVVWEDNRETGEFFNNDIWGQFVSKEGVLIDTNFPICMADSGQWKIDIAFGDSNYLVVWCDHRTIPYDIYGQLVSKEGTPIDSEFIICTEDDYQNAPAVAFNEMNYFVVWYGNGIHGQIISPDGGLIDTSFLISWEGGCKYYPALAFNGTRYLVVWADWGDKDMQTTCDVYGRLITSEGTPIDTPFIILKGSNTITYPNIASNGMNYLVVAAYSDTVFGQLISTDGSLIGEPVVVAAEPESSRGIPAVAYNGINYLVTWSDTRNGYGDIYGQWVSSEGVLIDTNFAISSAPWWSSENHSAIACCDGNCLVVWSDTRGPEPDYDIYGSIVTNVGIQEEPQGGELTLEVYPNPLRYKADISYQLSIKSRVSLKICDISGRTVVTLFNKIEEPGCHRITWDGKNLPDGIYFIKLEAGGYKKGKKIIIIN